MLIPRGDVRVLFSNRLVGGITGFALVMLFWPLVSRVLKRARGR
jgi:putative tricarboxylic transport membrane protein